MNNQSSKSARGGVGFTTVLLIVFVVLKLTGNIDWSWWWVLSPLWIPFAIFLIALIVFGITIFIKHLHSNKDWD